MSAEIFSAFLGWSRLQLKEIDDRMRKLPTMHNGFYPKSNVGSWLHLSRSEGSRRLIGGQGTAETAILGLKNYMRNSKERLIAARTIEEDEDEDWEKNTKWVQKEGNKWKENTVDTKTIKWAIYHANNR